MKDNDNESPDDELKNLRIQAAAQIAGHLINYPATRAGTDAIDPVHDGRSDAEPTPEQIGAVLRSQAMHTIGQLIHQVDRQYGISGAREVAQRAVDFFSASGMVYRLRVQESDRQNSASGAKRRISHSTVGKVFPSFINFWMAPGLTLNERDEGLNSMECINRDDLTLCANRFFNSGIRCSGFEKLLIEALVGAEFYATIKIGKQNPAAWSGKDELLTSMLVQWAYSKSRGGNPLHTMLITWGRLGIGAAKLVLFGLIAWFAVTKYQENENLMHLLAVIVVAAAGLNWLAKSTVRHVLSWAQSPGHQRKMLFQDNHFGRALAALAESYQTVSAPSMSVTLARESLLRGHGVGAAVDQIVVAFLDRALEAREFMWPVQVPELES